MMIGAALPRCQSCGRIVLTNKINVKGMIWHKRCCCCAICELQLSAKTARESAKTAYCIKHCPKPNAAMFLDVHQEVRNEAEERELPYFHDELGREEAEKRLSKTGDFLIRWSNSESSYIVSLKCPTIVIHSRIPRNGETVQTLREWARLHMLTRSPISEANALLTNPVNRPNYAETKAETATKSTSLKFLRTSSTSCQHGICQIWTGSITEVGADILVNSVNLTTNLAGGTLSRVIAGAGGPEIQKELDAYRQKASQPPTFGDVIVTSGYNLRSRFIFHTILKQWQDGQYVVQDLRQILKKIFQLADDRRCSTIAIPPIGSGILGYPKQIVAQVLYAEAGDYLDTHPDSSIHSIIFVINCEMDLLEIFERLQREEENESVYEEVIPNVQAEADGYYESLDFEFSKTTRDFSRSLSQMVLETCQYPPNWIHTINSPKPYDLVELESTSDEYAGVVANIVVSDGKMYEKFIAKIERIENGKSFQLYETLKKHMLITNTSDVMNERRLWHGTSASAKDNIIAAGFNRSYAGANAAIYGKGVYFAKDFSYSAQQMYSPPERQYGLKNVFLCRVLTGRSCQGRKDLLQPEFLPASTQQFDSAVDKIDDPRIFVVFKDFVAYPEYLISFYDDSDDYVNQQ